MNTEVICIGGGPAGLTAAYHLSKEGKSALVLEADPVYLGGISKTYKYKNFYFDIGGHRFFSKSKEVEDLWSEILPDDLLNRPRSSRIYYRGKFFSYPLKAMEALFKLGVLESTYCMISYFKSKLFPLKDPKNFEDWVSNQFGSRLYRIFFKTYTEKVWGMQCKDISADWAAQRIKGLSLGSAIYHSVFKSKNKSKDKGSVIKTLIDSFRYPRRGPGMMWDHCAEKIKKLGGEVLLGHQVVSIHYDSHKKLWKVTCKKTDHSECEFFAKHIISSAPLREVVNQLTPSPSVKTIQAANQLGYRDFITVALMIQDRGQFDDNWIYIHEPNVKVGRIQNFKSWSPEMVPDQKLNCYGLEYFCFEGDGMWESSDVELIELAKSEVQKLTLCELSDIIDGCVVRQKKAYPIYDDQYRENVETIRVDLEKNFPNLHLVGRNGMHKYNNQDHAMMTALLTAKNILSGTQKYNVWAVNQDAEYHESGTAGESTSELKEVGLRDVPSLAK